MGEKCFFCDRDHPDMLEIGKMPGGILYLHRDQTHPGRLLLAADRHVKKVTDLDPEEYAALAGSVYKAAQAVTRLLKPEKINYLVFGDKGTHLHVHIVPKYVDGKDWGRVFLTDEPEPVYLSDREYAERITALKAELGI